MIIRRAGLPTSTPPGRAAGDATHRPAGGQLRPAATATGGTRRRAAAGGDRRDAASCRHRGSPARRIIMKFFLKIKCVLKFF